MRRFFGGDMMEFRYRDKAYLSTYDLNTKIFDNYNFSVEDAAPLRSVYILTTNEGFKIFKKIVYSKAELIFIYEALNIIRSKYPHIINYKENIYDIPYVEYNSELYVVLDLIEGRECLFENPIDLRNTAEALAKYHEAAHNIKLNSNLRNNSGKMISRYKHRIRDMESYKKIAQMHVNKSEFDRLYLEYVDYYLNCAKSALEHVLSSPYRELCEIKKTLCHHDLAHHNVLMGNDNNVYFIDFDYAIIDLPYHDISNLITKAAKSNGWCTDILDTIIGAYESVNDLNLKEFEVLYGYLLFPLDFYEVTTGYYMRTKEWDEDDFTDKLRRKAGYKEDREIFLNHFKEKWLGKNENQAFGE
jgi:CotS family spore coat protein